MAIRVPYRQAVAPAENPGVAVSGQALNAVNAATTNLAGTVAGIAGDAWEQGEEMQRVENAGLLADFQTQIQQAAAEYDQELLTNNDPTSWGPGLQKKLQEVQGRLKIESAPPAVKEAYAKWSAGYQASQLNKISHDAGLYKIEQSKLARTNALTVASNSGDFSGAVALVDADPLLSPAEKDQLKIKIQGNQQQYLLQQDIKNDPKAAIAHLESPDYLKTPGASIDLREQGLQMAKQQLRVQSSDAFDEGLNFIATATQGNQPITNEDLDTRFAGRLEPRTLLKLKEAAANAKDDSIRALRSSPEYQEQLAGDAGASLDGLAGAENFEAGYADASFKIDGMQDGPLKRYYSEKLKAAKEGKTAEIKSATDRAFTSIESLEKSGKFGAVSDVRTEMPVSRAINDGFLKDENKLLSLGYDKEQAQEVLNAKNKEGDVDDASQLEVFRRLYSRRKGQATADGLTGAVGEAIANSQTQATYQSLEQKRQSVINELDRIDKVGRAKQEINSFLKTNPNAAPKEIEQKVFEIAGAEGRIAFQGTKLSARPLRGSANEGDRITSYGYQTDTTPDSNSLAGIGAWVSPEEQRLIKAGKRTPNKLQAGDIAVSPDVERQFRHAGINPGDTVEIALDDGTITSGRWMDRTAQSYNGKPLTGRFDVYHPGQKGSPLDGKRVVGWNKRFVKGDGSSIPTPEETPNPPEISELPR